MGDIPMLKYSNFQAWVLFRLFDDQDHKYRAKDLLNQCCDSAITDLKSNGDAWKRELAELERSSLVYRDLGDYTISETGIIYVRQNLAALERVCNDSSVPKDVEYKENTTIQEALRNKTVSAEMIIKHGLGNMQAVRILCEMISRLTS